MMGTARYWREIPQRYRYETAVCTKCGKAFFPPRLVCSKCRGRDFQKGALPATGTVETFTVIRVPPSGFQDEAPYVVGIVQLEGGIRVTAQIADAKPDEVKIGDTVRIEFRRLRQDGPSGIICYGYKFVKV